MDRTALTGQEETVEHFPNNIHAITFAVGRVESE